MKKTLLIGLAAVALGSMTACSNILEEEGVISAQTGTLTIGVEADGRVDVTTKATEEDLSNVYESLKDNFFVKLTPPAGTSISEELTTGNLTYLNVKNKSYKLPAKTGYTLTATYGTMDNKSFAWDNPVFGGTSSIEVVANRLTQGSVNCTLTNSIIDVNVGDLNTDSDNGNGVIITSLYAIVGDDETTKFYLIGDNNVEEGKSLTSNVLYVAANVDAKLIMEGKLESDASKTFKTTAVEIQAEGTSVTTEKTKYKVKYALSNANGQLQLLVSIDGKVNVVNINETVDPYAPATNE